MFVHPHCPCTRASLGELERVLARYPNRLAAHIVFFKPAAAAGEWLDTVLWRKAAGVPGLVLHADEAGFEARLFRSEISGQVVLYNAEGGRAFYGGITISRGHSGDNPGRLALQSAVEGKGSRTPGALKNPVFGCPLFNPDDEKGDAACNEQT
jgi:hypothetical protein